MILRLLFQKNGDLEIKTGYFMSIFWLEASKENEKNCLFSLNQLLWKMIWKSAFLIFNTMCTAKVAFRILSTGDCFFTE